MAWSTREIAELAGTSLRAVRHYHHVGLLPEPERRPNGYKQYGVAHLIRVLRIKRLTDLGFSLPQIATMNDTDDHPEQALRTLDPAAAGADLSDADHSIVVVLSRVLSSRGLQAYAEMLKDLPADPVAAEFDDLSADADERTRRAVAERLAPYARTIRAKHPGLTTLHDDAPHSAGFAAQTVDTAMRDLYNRAQLDVVHRTEKLLRTAPSQERSRGSGASERWAPPR